MNVLRERNTTTVGPIELLFDLVYVFAIIQLSHLLLNHMSPAGALQSAVVFAAVWWGWNYTAWAMNWLDPHARAVQAAVAVWMFAALAMATAIPDAYGERAALFVGAYLFLQLSRSAFMIRAFRGQRMARNYAQLLAWSGIAGVAWIAGLFAPEEARVWIWLGAVALDFLAPAVGFRLPKVGPTPMSSWPVAEEHLAERNRLVFIIALGESVLVLGGTLTETALTPAVITAATLGFTAIVLLWRLYFDAALGNSEHDEVEVERAAAVSRGAYAYAHALMVAGAVLVAVGVELVVAHPGDTATGPVTATVVGGPAIFLVGNLFFNRAVSGTIRPAHLLALGALAFIALIAFALPVLVLGALSLAVLLLLMLGSSGWFRLPKLSAAP